MLQYRSYAYGKNHWRIDPDLREILRIYWPEYVQRIQELDQFGAFAGGPAYETAYAIDRSAAPAFLMHDVDGVRVDRALLHSEHADILRETARINRAPYEGGSWMEHFTFGYLLADPGLYCSLIVTNQTVYVIHKYAQEHTDWVDPLLSGTMWGATWMTESQGGSDLGANITTAAETDSGWIINGEKYFSSNAGLTDLAVVSARPDGAPAGPKGIALFLVPRLRKNGELNFHVRRLKEKSATRAVPSGEVEFHQSEAWLVGAPSAGIYYTLEMLTVSRLANAIGAMGIARKAYFEANERALKRTAFGKPICEHPLMRRDLTDIAVRNAAGMALTMRAIAAFNASWQSSPPYTADYHYARFLSHITKNRTADHSAAVTQLAMEIFGGVGFLDEYAIARWHREALVTPIWEGTGNIQSLDMLEAMQKKQAHEPFLAEMIPILESHGGSVGKRVAEQILRSVHTMKGLSETEAQWRSKELLNCFADAAQTALLYALADSAGERYAQIAELYAQRFCFHEDYPAWAINAKAVWAYDPDANAAQ